MVCRECGAEREANIHLAEPEHHCKRPEEHHEFVEDTEGRWDEEPEA